jgi:L-ascorbate metabolism protein UlaG (beta-lactamase superfamily)
MALGRDTTFTWYGHACVEVRTPGGKTILIDPWFSNPKSPKSPDQVDRCDLMLVTHGHFDHFTDAVPIASRTRPDWPVIHELSLWLQHNYAHNDKVVGMNKGGTVTFGDIKVTMTGADHSAGDWDARNETTLYLGDPVGFVVEVENGFRFFHAGDTVLTNDLRLIGELWRPDFAMLPIGGHFTMDPRAAAYAVEMLGVKHVMGIHYGTFPILAGTPAQLREELAKRGLSDVTVHELQPGGTLE